MDLVIPKDAFSDGQVRSKLWLANNLNLWAEKYLLEGDYTLTWYGSWVGLGPFLLLCLTSIKIKKINLIEIDPESLQTSKHFLDHWNCLGVEINLICEDMNFYLPDPNDSKQIFINTACEHLFETEWLRKIPAGSIVLVQSTNMKHVEHINLSESIDEFRNKMAPFIDIFEKDILEIAYPTYTFARFMLFGKK